MDNALQQKQTSLLLSEIISNISLLDPVKIILFGSYASETHNADSDIDILVILDSDIIPSSYDEKMMLSSHVRKTIYSLSRRKAIDLVVYTSGEFEALRKMRTSFYNEIERTGRVLYEKAG